MKNIYKWVGSALAGCALLGAAANASAIGRGSCTVLGWTALILTADNGGASPTQKGTGRFDKGDFKLTATSVTGSSTTARILNSAGNVVAGCTVTDAVGGSGTSIFCTSIVGATAFEVTAS